MNRERAEGGLAEWLGCLACVVVLAWLSLAAGPVAAGATAPTGPRACCDAYDQAARSRVEVPRDVRIEGEMGHRPGGNDSLGVALHGGHKKAPLDSRVATNSAGSSGTAIEGLWAQAPNRGFLGGWSKAETLRPGTIIDRYGAETGRFFSPAGTSFEARALPAGSGPLQGYEVLKPFDVQAGIIAPAFDQPGLGIQYMSQQNVADLIEAGILKPVG